MRSFSDRFLEMGLRTVAPNSFEYTDRLSSVMYKQLQTIDGRVEVPLLGVFTKDTRVGSEYKFVATVSELYQFEGNEVINERIRNSVSEIRSPIFEEFPMTSSNFTVMRNEIILRHANSVRNVGDVYPQIIVFNTYNGAGAKDIRFGFVVYQGRNRMSSFGFKTKILSMRQVHTVNSRTTATSIGSYVQIFSSNILDLIQMNFNNVISAEDVLKTLDLIEQVGKRKRENISKMLQEISEPTNGVLSSWNIFLAITKFSALEKNINSKSMLENIAERVLVLPEQMYRALGVIHT